MNKDIITNQLKHIALIILGALILCFWAFYNQYPLYFNSDTAAYLEAAFHKTVGPDRPVMYGLFMYYIGLQQSLWPVVFIQALIIAYLLYLYFMYFIRSKQFKLYYIIFIIVVTFCTGASFNVSWLLADVFIAVSLLAFGLLIFVNHLNKYHRSTVMLLFVLGIVVHNSHFFICLGLTLIIMIGYIIKPIRDMFFCADLRIRSMFYVLVLLLISNVITASVHYGYGGGFKSSRGGEIFLFGNLVEMGIVNTYLAENCETNEYELCMYKDTLPNNFLWAENSPIHKMGGWKNCQEEFSAIIKEILISPQYLKDVVFKSAVYTLKQLSHFDTGEAGMATQRIEFAFGAFYPDEFKYFDNSKQRKGELNFDFVNFAQSILVAWALFFMVWALYENKLSPKMKLFVIFILLGVLINAAICAIFSGVYFRYQARVVWLLLLPMFLYFTNKFTSKSNDPR